MKFNTPCNYCTKNQQNFISSKIKICTNLETDYQSVQSVSRIPKNEVILIEYPCATLYGEEDIDRGLQTIQKYFILAEQNHPGIATLYPRKTRMHSGLREEFALKSNPRKTKIHFGLREEFALKHNPRNEYIYTFPRTPLIKQIHKIVKTLQNTKTKANTPAMQKLGVFFSKYTKTELEFYYAKYIYNAFEGFSYGPLTLPYLAKFNHSCNSNIAFTFDKNSGAMMVRTTQVIEPGQELFNSYLCNKTIPNHRQYLFEHYGFVVECKCK